MQKAALGLGNKQLNILLLSPFFENLKSWSHTSLFVWDWIAGENRIPSDFPRFYRIAKCVTRRIGWICVQNPTYPTTLHRVSERSDKSPFDKGGFRGNVNTRITKKEPIFSTPFFVIPAVETMRIIYFKYSKRCAIFVVFTHTTLTL